MECLIMEEGPRTYRHYIGLAPHDADGLIIASAHHVRVFQDGVDSLTTLTQPLAPGDTQIHVADASGWNTWSSQFREHVAIHAYRSPSGRDYSGTGYTRLVWRNAFAWSGVDKTNNIINLHPHIFDNDALVFKNLNSRKVSLKSKKSKQVLTVSFPDFNYLGIWAKPNANFVCIEPWLGIADSEDSDRNFEHKEALISLEPQGTFTAKYFISVEE
jgi:hypothetical protein